MQNVIGIYNRGMYPVSATGGYLVDDYSPEASYSFRKTSSTATNCIRVRRSSDDVEQDIGFSGDDLDTSAMATFVGSDSAYLVTWFDQSGNGYDATQGSAGSQPRIVNAGTNETLNGFVCAQFDGSNDFLSAGTVMGVIGGLDTFFSAAVISGAAFNSTVYARSRFSSVNGRYGMYGASGSVITTFFQNGGGNSIITAGSGAGVWNQEWDAVNNTHYKNNVAQGSPLSFTGTMGSLTSRFLVGAYNNAGDTGEQAGYYFSGKQQELNLWSVDKSGDRTDINTNINDYYSIY